MNWIAGYKQHYKALIFLGLPIVIGQVGVIILGFADTLMIGHHSTEELGAASFVNNVFTLCIIFSTGFSYWLTPIVGSLYGNRRFAEAGQALRCSLVANVLVALLLTFIMTVVYFNVERLGQPEELMPLIKPYYLVLLASLVFVMLFNGFKQFTYGITDTVIVRTNYKTPGSAQLFDVNSEYIIGYGEKDFTSSTEGEGMIEFNIPVEYRYTNRKPTAIIIVASSSKYGDYFSGGTGSTMWLDDFELVYE